MKSTADDDMRWALTGYTREGVRLVHASGNQGEVQITLRRQPISAVSLLKPFYIKPLSKNTSAIKREENDITCINVMKVMQYR